MDENQKNSIYGLVTIKETCPESFLNRYEFLVLDSCKAGFDELFNNQETTIKRNKMIKKEKIAAVLYIVLISCDKRYF